MASTLEKSSLEKKCTLISNYIQIENLGQYMYDRFEPFSKSFVRSSMMIYSDANPMIRITVLTRKADDFIPN
jgi:hypothetical protein